MYAAVELTVERGEGGALRGMLGEQMVKWGQHEHPVDMGLEEHGRRIEVKSCQEVAFTP